uniref:Oxysterol-binding protein-related protein 1 n=1 Tax=Cacopsylla melanoneura TaxID=428564 RepID=A0A8D8WUP2_9HEMI
MTERNSGSDSNSSSEEEPTYSLSAELDKLSLKEIHELFLYQCRNGQLEKIKLLLDHCKDKYVEINLSQKGESKSNLGWTPLHLASYFGHKSVVEFLLDQGVDINAVNDAGDTALHKAAFVGREDIVCLLISKNANINIVNGEGRTPRDVCKHNDEARKLLAAAEKTEGLQKEQKLLNAARANDLDSINSLAKESKYSICFPAERGHASQHQLCGRAREYCPPLCRIQGTQGSCHTLVAEWNKYEH